MNILLVAPWSLDASGGVSSAVVMLYRQYEQAKHRAIGLVFDDSNWLRLLPTANGLTCYGMYLRSPHGARAPFRAFLTFCLFLPLTLFQLHRFLRKNDVDVVHIHYPLPPVAYFGFLRR